MRNGALAEGTRVGRFVVLRDLDGRTYAVVTSLGPVLCETEGEA